MKLSDEARAREEQSQFGEEDTSEGYRRHRVRNARRGPDDGSKEQMRTFHLPEAWEQF